MIFKSLCRHAEIGANSYLLETSNARIVLDAGMHPKHEGAEAIPHFEMLEDGSIDSAIITHSHLDHVGTLPVLLESQPQARVFLTEETADLALALLHNSVNVMQSKRIELGITEYPLFEHRELDEHKKSFERRAVERPFDLDAHGSIRATFHDAGHILGSVGVTLQAEGKRMLIPVFAIGKTQEVLAMIHRFKRQHLIPKKTPVYIGGLSTKMTLIFDSFSNVSRRQLPGFNFLTDMELETGARKNRGSIPFVSGCIYALSSGMMTEKTVSNNFARQGVLENKRHGLFFVGYADPASPGGRIRCAKPGEEVLLDPAYPPVPLHCEMQVFDFSGHATREAIADYIVKVRPKKAFLVHGDAPAIAWFRQELNRRLPDTDVIVPQPGDAHLI